MSLNGQRVAVIGRAGGIARAIVEECRGQGAEVVAAGRNLEALRDTYSSMSIQVEPIDVTEEQSVRDFAEALGNLDHVVLTASARTRGGVQDLDIGVVLTSLATKVIGPLVIAKHFATRIRPTGSLVFASGVTGQRPAPKMSAVAATNGAVDALTRSLALELAPVRVNAFAPGTVDSGAWDALGRAKARFLDDRASRNPVGRVGFPDDVALAVTSLMTNTFITGVTLNVDGGESFA